MYVFKKNRKIQEKISNYLKMVEETLLIFSESMESYLEDGFSDHFSTLREKTSKSESISDDLKCEIENELYEKSLLPESRRDILVIIDKVDMIANTAESILRTLHTQNILIPKQFHAKIRELILLSVETCKMTIQQVSSVLQNEGEFKEAARRIDANESIGDRLEEDMIFIIFREDHTNVDQILYRDAIIRMGNLLDICEVVADILTIFSIKRNV
ncbi:MAG: DUF47 family protein [Verrucomicrobiota bacterium]|nr:DUF47 family protein [Verrucomicrobiota bacterium]